MQISRIRLSDKTSRFSRVTPSAVSERFSELLGRPISRSLTACCVCLELRPLPSPSITRLPRYYEPLRHPSAPGLSLTGVRLIIPDHAVGLPVLRALSLCTCCRHYPGAADGRSPRSKSPIHISLPRFHFRVGLHIVLFEACSAFTRVAACTLARLPYVVTAIRRLQTLRHLHACPGCFRRERSPGGTCTHLSGALVSSGNFQHRGLHFCGSCDGVGVINGSFAIAANSGKCAGRPRFCHCGKDRINLSPVRSSGP